VEGFDNNDQGLAGGGSIGAQTGGANTTISPDDLQEYRIIDHNFSAEYGKAGGFVTDTVLKSGTNQWHGSLFEYNRVQALAANSFFSNRNDIKDSRSEPVWCSSANHHRADILLCVGGGPSRPLCPLPCDWHHSAVSGFCKERLADLG
jgi:hypothetical protein